jgi:hypothetical protein
VIDLHPDIVSQLLQDIPFIIDFMALIRKEAEEHSEKQVKNKSGILSVLLMSIHTHNSDSTIDLLQLIQKNVGLSVVTSSAHHFISTVNSETQETSSQDPSLVPEEMILYDWMGCCE